MKKILLTLTALAMLIPLAFAQKPKTTQKADTARSTKETIVIITDENAGNYFEQRNALDLKTLIKINPLVAVNGDLPVYVEQKLTDRLSAEGSIGMTFKNYVGDFITGQFNDGAELTRADKTGYSYSLALHYFPKEGTPVLEDFYFGAELRSRTYNYQATKIGQTDINVNQSKVVTDYKITCGNINYKLDHIFVETYFGLGVRKKTFTNEVSEEEYYDEKTGNTEDIVVLKNRTALGPVLSLGFKLGYAF